MAKTKQIPEDLRNRVAFAHEAGKVYKTVSEELELQQQYQIVHKWREFRILIFNRSGPTKTSPITRNVIVCEIRNKSE